MGPFHADDSAVCSSPLQEALNRECHAISHPLMAAGVSQGFTGRGNETQVYRLHTVDTPASLTRTLTSALSLHTHWVSVNIV